MIAAERESLERACTHVPLAGPLLPTLARSVGRYGKTAKAIGIDESTYWKEKVMSEMGTCSADAAAQEMIDLAREAKVPLPGTG